MHFLFYIFLRLEYLDDSDDDDREDEESGGIRRTCSLSDLNALPNTSSSSSSAVPRRKRSFHKHRNGFNLDLLHSCFYAQNSAHISATYFAGCDLKKSVHVSRLIFNFLSLFPMICSLTL